MLRGQSHISATNTALLCALQHWMRMIMLMNVLVNDKFTCHILSLLWCVSVSREGVVSYSHLFSIANMAFDPQKCYLVNAIYFGEN